MLDWVPTSHEAAFHSAEPSFLSLPIPTFPSCCLRAGLRSWKDAVSVPSQRSLKVSTSLGASLGLVQGSPLEKNQHCPPCVPSLEPIYPVGPPSPSGGLFPGFLSLQGLPGVVGFVLLGVLVLLLSFSLHPGPPSVSSVPPTHVHEQICNLPWDLQSVEAKLPTSSVCHEVMWGFHRVCHCHCVFPNPVSRFVYSSKRCPSTKGM